MSASAGGRRESAGGPPLGARPADLVIRGLWSADGHRFARWSPAGRERIRSGAARLRTELAQWVNPHCAHVRGHGGVKGAARFAHAACARLPFAARFDIRSSLRVHRSPRASRSAGPGRGHTGVARSHRPVPRASRCAPQRPGPGEGRLAVALAGGPLPDPSGPRHGVVAAQGRPLRAVRGRLRHLRPDAAQAQDTRSAACTPCCERCSSPFIPTNASSAEPPRGSVFWGSACGLDVSSGPPRNPSKGAPGAPAGFMSKGPTKTSSGGTSGAGPAGLRGGLGGWVSSKGRCARIWIIVLKRIHITGWHVRPA